MIISLNRSSLTASAWVKGVRSRRRKPSAFSWFSSSEKDAGDVGDADHE